VTTTPEGEFAMSEENAEPKKAIKVKIEVDEKLAGGSYANFCLVNHSDSEFILDAFFLQPQKPTARHAARLVMSPRSAKRLHMLLTDRLAKYEQLFGRIDVKPGSGPEVVN
jgi:hypothetical protein